jgi:hypothetical protein
MKIMNAGPHKIFLIPFSDRVKQRLVARENQLVCFSFGAKNRCCRTPTALTLVAKFRMSMFGELLPWISFECT